MAVKEYSLYCGENVAENNSEYVIEPSPVILTKTWLWENTLKYWEAKGVYAFSDTGGEVTAGITHSECHAQAFRRIIKISGLQNIGDGGSRIIEYGSGTGYFADIVAWIDRRTPDSPLFGQRDWQWVVTDLQSRKLEDMRKVTTYKDRIKFAVVDANNPSRLDFLSGQEICEYKTEAGVANYLIGALPWRVYRKGDRGAIEVADFQTVLKSAGVEFVESYGSSDMEVLSNLDWGDYEKKVGLKANFRLAKPQEIDGDVEIALNLSAGKETVVNNTGLQFLRSVLRSLPEEGIFFGNEYMGNQEWYDRNVKKYGQINNLMLGGSTAIPVNIAHIAAVLEKEGYFIYYSKDPSMLYGLFTISKRPNLRLKEEIKNLLSKEVEFVKKTDEIARNRGNFDKNMPKEKRLEIIESLEDLTKEYGLIYAIELQLSVQYMMVGDFEKAVAHGKKAWQFSPHCEVAKENYQHMLWAQRVGGFII